MQINKISLAKKTLLLLEKKSWKNISISSVIKNEKKTIIKNKIELLININRYFDYINIIHLLY